MKIASTIRVFCVLAAVAVVANASTAEAGLFAKLKGLCKKDACCEPCEPVCCPEPVCCEPEPVCCEPEPVCCEPVVEEAPCCEPVVEEAPCCEPEPVVEDCGCEAEPVCCEPAPVCEPCCEPAPACEPCCEPCDSGCKLFGGLKDKFGGFGGKLKGMFSCKKGC